MTRRFRKIFSGAFLCVIALVFPACAGTCVGPGNIDEIKKMPELILYYPGSYVDQTFAQAASGSPSGGNPAEAGAFLGAAANASEVHQFYERELRARGWATRSGFYASTTAGESVAYAWARERFVFHLGIRQKQFLREGSALQQYETVYVINIIAEEGENK